MKFQVKMVWNINTNSITKNLEDRTKIAPGRVVDDAFVSWFPQERVNLFGFWSRYSGSDYSGEGKGRISRRLKTRERGKGFLHEGSN